MQEPYGKGSSESILTSSLAGDIARCLLKRRQRHRWAGRLSCEKPVDQDADFIPSRRKATRQPRQSRVDCRSCVVREPAHAEKQHAREPGDLQRALVGRSRPVREGHKPQCGHARAGEVGLCRTTCEPAEQGRQLSAEAGEGRAQTKENIVQSHMYSTQSGKRMSQGLDGVRKAAKERKQERFTALLHHLSVDLLRDSFYALQRKASPGVDGVRWQEYETGLEDRLVDLHSRVHRGTYRAKPSRRVFIPKADGRQRPLGVAALEDKIVQQAAVTILKQIYEVDFKGFSYGFRPGRSPHQALDALTVGIQRKRVNWVLDADIRGFFDNLSHEWTMKFIEHRVADRRILRLIRKWLKAGVSEDGQWSETELGTPQGAVASPLIANVYLHYLFDLWADVWRRKVAKGDVIVVRYADDLVVGFQHRTDAERFLR